MYFVYSVFTAAGVILLSPYLLVRGMGRRQYLKNLPERMGRRFPPELSWRLRFGGARRDLGTRRVGGRSAGGTAAGALFEAAISAIGDW